MGWPLVVAGAAASIRSRVMVGEAMAGVICYGGGGGGICSNINTEGLNFKGMRTAHVSNVRKTWRASSQGGSGG